MMKSLECYCSHCFKPQTLKLENVRTADHWLHTPVAWIRFHHTARNARRELYFPDETGPDHTDLGRMKKTLKELRSFEQVMMTGTARFTLTCGDRMIRLNHQCHQLLRGLESLCFSDLNLKSLLNRKHMTRLLEKPKHCLGQMSRLNNRERSTTLRIFLIGLGANTVYIHIR